MERTEDHFYAPHCAISGCTGAIRAEADDTNYAYAVRLFFGYTLDRKTNSRRLGDRRIYICEYHLKHDPRARSIVWQDLLSFFAE
jgi:hypothetical protein